MRGYYDDPDATADAIDHDGWLHTGDIGCHERRRRAAHPDRKKDIYISGGFNVSPAEVENLLLGPPTIAQVAVVGIPTPAWVKSGGVRRVGAGESPRPTSSSPGPATTSPTTRSPGRSRSPTRFR